MIKIKSVFVLSCIAWLFAGQVSAEQEVAKRTFKFLGGFANFEASTGEKSTLTRLRLKQEYSAEDKKCGAHWQLEVAKLVTNNSQVRRGEEVTWLDRAFVFCSLTERWTFRLGKPFSKWQARGGPDVLRTAEFERDVMTFGLNAYALQAHYKIHSLEVVMSLSGVSDVPFDGPGNFRGAEFHWNIKDRRKGGLWLGSMGHVDLEGEFYRLGLDAGWQNGTWSTHAGVYWDSEREDHEFTALFFIERSFGDWAAHTRIEERASSDTAVVFGGNVGWRRVFFVVDSEYVAGKPLVFHARLQRTW